MTDPFVSLGERILRHADDLPDRPAIVCDDYAITYRELVLQAEKCASRLTDLGLKPGDQRRIAIIAGNSLDFAIVYVAGQLAGVGVALISDVITPDAQARMLVDSNSVVVFHSSDSADAVLTALSLSDVTRRHPTVEIGTTHGAEGVSTLERWVASSVREFTPARIDPTWTSDLIYSSGTTGVPKGITQPYRTRSNQNVSLAALGASDGTNIAQTVNLYSNYGLSSLQLALWWGGTFYCTRKFYGAALITLMQRARIDMIWFTPATLLRTIEAPGFETTVHNNPCVKICMGAPLSEEHKKAVQAAWPGAFIEGYGQTETGTLTLLPLHSTAPDKLGSVGLVLPSASVRIVDDAGNVLGVDEEGEIAGHTTTMMAGYHERADADAEVYWTDESGRRYVRTGDIGRLDADGYLWLCDRKKDMIISGGYNVYPSDIEHVLQTHPAVFEAAVVGCASARWGETPVAFVTLRDGTEVTEPELRDWINNLVSKIQRVAAVKVVSSLPSGTMGKILKRELRDRFVSEMGILP